jgi:hypothetical protein
MPANGAFLGSIRPLVGLILTLLTSGLFFWFPNLLLAQSYDLTIVRSVLCIENGSALQTISPGPAGSLAAEKTRQ